MNTGLVRFCCHFSQPETEFSEHFGFRFVVRGCGLVLLSALLFICVHLHTHLPPPTPWQHWFSWLGLFFPSLLPTSLPPLLTTLRYNSHTLPIKSVQDRTVVFSKFTEMSNHHLSFFKKLFFPLPPQFALFQLKAIILCSIQLIILSPLPFIPLVILLSLSDLYALCSYMNR